MIMESLITVFCSSFSQSPSTIQFASPCVQVMNATVEQNHFKSMVDREEHRVTQKYSDEVTDETGKAIWVIGAFAYTTYYQQRVMVSGPLKPFADSVSISLTQSSQNISISWHF